MGISSGGFKGRSGGAAAPSPIGSEFLPKSRLFPYSSLGTFAINDNLAHLTSERKISEMSKRKLQVIFELCRYN